jgi:hypothetical protein
MKSPMVKPKTYLSFWSYKAQKIWNKPLAEIRFVPTEYSAIYADGSKNGDSVAPAAVFGHQVYAARLSTACSIFSAEANAILLALKFAVSSHKSKFMICSDSLSCLLEIESCKAQNPFIL